METRLLLLVLSILALGFAESARAEPKMPNVVLISLDTVRADFLTFEDHETAPNISRLAERGTIFTHAIEPGPFAIS